MCAHPQAERICTDQLHVGFIGLGTMGFHMASSLLRAGVDLVVCDTNDAAADRLAAQGASVSRTPAQLAATPGKVTHSLPAIRTGAFVEDTLASVPVPKPPSSYELTEQRELYAKHKHTAQKTVMSLAAE